MLKKIYRSDKKKLFYIKQFSNLMYLQRFFFNLHFINFFFMLNLNHIFLYNGKKWIKLKLNQWKLGISLYQFCWFKKIAIYKKKQYLKKKKK